MDNTKKINTNKNFDTIKNKELNYNIKFIDDDNTIEYINLLTLNKNKKYIINNINNKIKLMNIEIKSNKSKIKINLDKYSNKQYSEKICESIMCLYGLKFYEKIRK